MSAWIVSARHVDAIVSAAIDHDLVGVRTARKVAQSLVDENRASIVYLYPNDDEPVRAHEEVRLVVEHDGKPLDCWALLRLIDCYVYQSSEHPGWEASDARGLCEDLHAAICDANGLDAETYREDPRARNAPWGIR